MSVFHVHDGWEFQRLEDGSVRISSGISHDELILPGVEWASVITAVSPNAGDGVIFQAAKDLHAGNKPSPVDPELSRIAHEAANPSA